MGMAGAADGQTKKGAGSQEDEPAVPFHGEDEGGCDSPEAYGSPHLRSDRAAKYSELFF